VSGSGAREARCSTTSTRRSRQKRSACGPKCRVRREKCPDRGRAKRVAALRVRVDHAKSCSHPDRTTLSASNVAVTRVRKQSHQAHFSGENDWKLGKSGQKKIGTKIIGPKFAENRCRLCRKLQKRNEIATGKANAAADADSEIEDRPRARPERARRVLLILNEAGIAFRTTIRISICVRTETTVCYMSDLFTFVLAPGQPSNGPPPDLGRACKAGHGGVHVAMRLCLRLIFLLLLLFGGVGAAPARGRGRRSSSRLEEDVRARRAANEANRRRRSLNADNGTSLPTTTDAHRRWSLPTNGAPQLYPSHQLMCRSGSVGEALPPWPVHLAEGITC